MPAQTTYAPVRRRFPFGLFQRWRQQATPTYTTMPGYNSPSVYVPYLYKHADVYHRPVQESRRSGGQLRDGRLYVALLFCDNLCRAGWDDAGRRGDKHRRSDHDDGTADGTRLHANHAHRPEQSRECQHTRVGHRPRDRSSGRCGTGSECADEPAGRQSEWCSDADEVHYSSAASIPSAAATATSPN